MNSLGRTKKSMNNDVECGKLRDHFAGIVLVEILKTNNTDISLDDCETCYEIADTMMTARDL